jgi:hypothetical protein
MPKFNHMYDIAFSLDSDMEDASDVTTDMLRAALLKRVEDVFKNSGEWKEAFDLFGTFENPDDGQATHTNRAEPKRCYYASECYGRFGVFQASGSQVGGWWPTMELAEQAAQLGNALTGKEE